MAATVFGLQNADFQLVPVAVKTAGYTAAAQDFVPVDTTSGSVTITLPASPADRTRVLVKMVATASSHTVTIAGGGGTFNTSGGSTTLTLSLLNQGALLQYSTGLNVWYVQSDDLPLSQLDLRYGTLGTSVDSVNITKAPYGADPSGAADSTAAITAAVTAAAAAKVPVYIPAGTYKITSALDWRVAGLVVTGDGPQNTKIVQNTANTQIIRLAGQAQKITGLTFAYTSQQVLGSTSAIAMSFGDDTIGSCFESEFSDLAIQLAQTGMAIDPSVSVKAGLFSCGFSNIEINGYSTAAIHLNGSNGLGAANCTGCHFSNVYVHNNFTGSDAGSTSWPVYFENWDELVLSQLNVEHANVFLSDAVAFVSCGSATVNGLHLEHLELSGNPGWGHVYVSHATTALINGMSIRFPTMTGTSYNSVVRLNGTEGPKCFIRGLNEPNDSGATYNSNHPLVDFNSATNGYVSLEGVSASQTTTLEINAGTGCALSAPNVTPGAYTSFGTGGLGNVLNTNSGTSQTMVAGTWYYSAIFIPVAIPITGILAPVDGGTGGTDKWMAALWAAAGGTALAHSATAGTTTAVSGSKFKMPFTSVLWVASGIYVIGIQSNGTTAKLEVFPNNLEGFITGSVSGVFGTVPSLSPSASYTQNAGPMVMTY